MKENELIQSLSQYRAEGAAVSTSIGTSASTTTHAELKTFLELPSLLVELVFEAIELYDEDENRILANEKSRLSLFMALLASTCRYTDYQPALHGAVTAMEAQFAQYVLDGALDKGHLMLRAARLNPQIANGRSGAIFALRALLTTNKTLVEQSGLVRKGKPLQLSYGTSDWLPAGSNKEAMVEMLLRFTRMVDNGEEIINETEQTLFPNGRELFVELQQQVAKMYIETVTAPLADLIKTASIQDVFLALAVRDRSDEDIPTYIETTLANNTFWKTLMDYRAATKQWMQESKLYNPYFFEEALALCGEMVLKERWYENNMNFGEGRIDLLYVHALGGIQAFSPTLVRMTDGCDDADRYYKMDSKKREDFAYTRPLRFQLIGEPIIKLVGSGFDLAGIRYWSTGGGVWGRFVGCLPVASVGKWGGREFRCRIFSSSKNKTLLETQARLPHRPNSDAESKPSMRTG